MSTNGLAPPGSSSYHSNTLSVGDGTWDSARNDFLLPNLQGLNFATTRYNGMGNRFRGMPEYATLILGHGVLAAITFLGIVPLAIFLAKYGREWPGARTSFKLHVYCQIIVVFLATVIIVLGFVAVGPRRSLTNPHHGIGLAIYVLILFQFIYGTLMYRRERRRSTFPTKLPFAVWIHKLLGRSIGLLAITQVALGLTLYGSPKVLFILYAVWGAFLLFAYLALDYHYKPRVGQAGPGGGGGAPGGAPSEFYSDYGSYLSGQAPRRDQHHWGRDLLAAGGVLGAYELWKNRRDRKRAERADAASYGGPPRRSSGRPPRTGAAPGAFAGVSTGAGTDLSGRPPSQSQLSRESWEDEKFDNRRQHTWRNRALGAAGAFAAFEGAKAFFNRRKNRDDKYTGGARYGSGRYRPPLGGNQSMVSDNDVSRVEAGEAPSSPNTPRIDLGGAQPMTPTTTPSRPPRRSPLDADDFSYDSRDSVPPPRRRTDDNGPHTLRDSIAVFGAIAGVREWNKRRRERREYHRAEDMRRQELDNEDVFQRRHENTYPRPQDASALHHAESSTLMTGPTNTAPIGGPDTLHPPLPADAGTLPGRAEVLPGAGYPIPPPPAGPHPGSNSRLESDGRQRPQFGSAYMPQGAVQPDPNRLVSDARFTEANTAANEGSAYGRDHGDHLGRDALEAAAIGGIGAAAMSGARRTNSDLNAPRHGSTAQSSASQLNSSGDARVSLKLHPHKDGQHVTLRRLSEEEAAAERAAQRQQRRNSRLQQQQQQQQQRRLRRGSSLSSGNDEGPPNSNQRYRRPSGPPSSSGPRPAIRPSYNQPITNIPPPPPMSSSALGAGSNSAFPTRPNPATSETINPASQTGSLPYPRAQQSPQTRPPVPNTSFSPPPPQGQQIPGSAIGSFGSPAAYDTATGTDVSAFADNRRRRRAERARRLEAARGTGGGGSGSASRVEFQ